MHEIADSQYEVIYNSPFPHVVSPTLGTTK